MRAWMVRAGSDGEREEPDLNGGIVAAGWPELTDDIRDVTTREQLRTIVEATYPGYNPRVIGNWVGQLWPSETHASLTGQSAANRASPTSNPKARARLSPLSASTTCAPLVEVQGDVGVECGELGGSDADGALCAADLAGDGVAAHAEGVRFPHALVVVFFDGPLVPFGAHGTSRAGEGPAEHGREPGRPAGWVSSSRRP